MKTPSGVTAWYKNTVGGRKRPPTGVKGCSEKRGRWRKGLDDMQIVYNCRKKRGWSRKERGGREGRFQSGSGTIWQTEPKDRYSQARTWYIRQKTKQEVQEILNRPYESDQEFFNVLGRYIEENREAFSFTYSTERGETAPFFLSVE